MGLLYFRPPLTSAYLPRLVRTTLPQHRIVNSKNLRVSTHAAPGPTVGIILDSRIDPMLERDYQRGLISRIEERLPGCLILKNDPNHNQGIPDLIIIFGSKWAALEVKRSADAAHRPNQDHFIGKLGEWSFASFIYPENEKGTLDELERALKAGGPARISERQQAQLGQLRRREAGRGVQDSTGGSDGDQASRPGRRAYSPKDADAEEQGHLQRLRERRHWLRA